MVILFQPQVQALADEVTTSVGQSISEILTSIATINSTVTSDVQVKLDEVAEVAAAATTAAAERFDAVEGDVATIAATFELPDVYYSELIRKPVVVKASGGDSVTLVGSGFSAKNEASAFP